MNFIQTYRGVQLVHFVVALASFVFLSTNGLAFTINIDPGSYPGRYNPAGRGFVTGPTTVELNAGSYSVAIAPGNGFNFDVDGSGNITTVTPAAAAQGNGSTLTFNTTTITVQPGAYSGTYNISGVNNTSAPGQRSFILLPGLYDYVLGIAPSNSFRFSVDAGGNITSINPAAAAQGSGSTLTFNTTTILVDPNAYTGTYSVVGVNNTSAPGQRSFILLPGLRDYILGIAPGTDFRFHVDGSGVVTTTSSAAVGLGNTLAFNTTTILVVPQNYSGTYSIRGVDQTAASGSRSFILLPGVNGYILDVAVNVNSRFNVASPCAVDPTRLVVGAFTFDITCGLPDTDDDGVPDDTDNCPNTANPDQLDQDLDGLGNLCDPDRDGDGIGNAADNCPDFENAQQVDSDDDGMGDACEADDDNDGVGDELDNCPLASNPDQADSDLDGDGDACDPDDDNDGTVDEFDNCPLEFNLDQADGDDDGEGDVCDGDVDGDGVANADDLCSLSPRDRPINADGCTGTQFIARQCARESFVQHGQYVSCVAHAANDAVDQGLLGPQEKAQLVKEAAQSKE